MSTEKPWLSSYLKGVEAEIDPEQYQSLSEMLEESMHRFADRPAFTNMGKTLSYSEMDKLSGQFAAFLRSEMGLCQGDRVALMMPNILQYPIAIFGVLRAGLTVVNTNPMYTARELRHQLQDSGAKVVVVLENFAATLQSVLPDTEVKQVITTGIGDLLSFPKNLIANLVLRHVKKSVPQFHISGAISFLNALKRGTGHPSVSATIAADDLAFLQYTGGTTGVAKGAMLTHRNLVANMLQSTAWLGSAVDDSGEVIVTALPLYHIFALTANCLVFFRLGGHNHLITNPRDMPGFVAAIKNLSFTAITGVNTLFNGLLNTPGFDQVDFSRLKLALGGGMAVQRAVAERWKATTGITLIEAYGLTETSPGACMNPMDLSEYNASIGLPISSTECCIMSDDGKQLAIGERGELCIRGPQVMKGYWQRPEETANVLSDDGWLKTGDVAVMDEAGFFKIVDRKKDMILVSGFNVYPNEVENVAVSMPGISEAAAIGLPDEKSGEIVKLFLVATDNTIDQAAVKAWCKQHLTGYKVPKKYQFTDELPKSNVGKILRRELREAEMAGGYPEVVADTA